MFHDNDVHSIVPTNEQLFFTYLSSTRICEWALVTSLCFEWIIIPLIREKNAKINHKSGWRNNRELQIEEAMDKFVSKKPRISVDDEGDNAVNANEQVSKLVSSDDLI